MLAEALADPFSPCPHRVTEVVRETSDVVTLALAPLDTGLARVEPGQFVMCWVFGVGEIPISVSRTGDDGTIELTVQSVGAVSDAVVTARTGDVLGLRGPYGTAWPLLATGGGDVLVVAGGLGLAPLRMALDRLAESAPTTVTVVIGAREPSRLLFVDDVLRWRTLGMAVHETVDAADRRWNASVGTATALIDRLGTIRGTVFVCGPELMMTSATAMAIANGANPNRVWISLERNMHCGIAHCGRCQLGPLLLCRDGAVVRWDRASDELKVRGR
jgi:NAD(P)H-flavin reductase